MCEWKCYHGTSSARLSAIQKSGFIPGSYRFHNYSAASGVYFVCGRPLVAKRFAEEAAMKDGSEPVVLETVVRVSSAEYVLDLTTDEGMNQLYESYEQNCRFLESRRALDASHALPQEYQEYVKSVHDSLNRFLEKLHSEVDTWKGEHHRLNWDTVAVQSLVIMYGVKVVVKITQEGHTFNFLFAHREFEKMAKTDYRGIRTHDHIEVCVTDVSILTLDDISVYESPRGVFNERFAKIVSVPLIPDAQERRGTK